MGESWSRAAILLLGIWHGINPGMGWLFAVALGLQEGKRRAVWRALPPLALGHGLAIAAALLAAALLGRIVSVDAMEWVVAAVLLGVGIDKLFRSRHPRFGGMRVGARDLTIWSALMASAHGAGLMVLPFVPGSDDRGAHAAGGHGAHAPAILGHALSPLHAGAGDGLPASVLTTLIHTAGYLLVTGIVALVVYEKLGLRLLRSAWVNLDLIWALALIATALLTPLI